jgi:DNA recombination protein RmuC
MLVIVMGLRGMQIERHAHEVMSYCAQLGKDFERFRDDFETIGTHIGHAQKKHGEATGRLGKFEAQLERAADWEAGPEPADEPTIRAIEAA